MLKRSEGESGQGGTVTLSMPEMSNMERRVGVLGRGEDTKLCIASSATVPGPRRATDMLSQPCHHTEYFNNTNRPVGIAHYQCRLYVGLCRRGWAPSFVAEVLP